jgi:hypothetical protein
MRTGTIQHATPNTNGGTIYTVIGPWGGIGLPGNRLTPAGIIGGKRKTRKSKKSRKNRLNRIKHDKIIQRIYRRRGNEGEEE